jgi:hypothetical protein
MGFDAENRGILRGERKRQPESRKAWLEETGAHSYFAMVTGISTFTVAGGRHMLLLQDWDWALTTRFCVPAAAPGATRRGNAKPAEPS